MSRYKITNDRKFRIRRNISSILRKYLLRKEESSQKIRLRILIFFVTILLLILLWREREILSKNTQFGYIGIFIVNFVSNATILLPLPGIASVLLGGAVLSPVIVGLISALGSTLGELFSYFLGFGGRALVKSFEKESSMLKNVEKLFHRMGFISILVFSILPLPFFDFIGIMAGAFNYPIWKFVSATFLGRFLRNLVIAYAGANLL